MWSTLWKSSQRKREILSEYNVLYYHTLPSITSLKTVKITFLLKTSIWYMPYLVVICTSFLTERYLHKHHQ